jgi:DNA-binding LacI/PurR family transcriptional regulator
MQRLLSRPSRPTAILVGNVMAAVGALAAAQNAGVRVPSDLSIVTIHDTRFARLTSPPLTAVKVPLYEMAYAGVELLLQLLRGGSSQALVISDPPPELIQRGSTAPP